MSAPEKSDLDKLVIESESLSSSAERGSVASISKAVAILRLLGAARSPLTMTEIARDTSLTPSSCHDLVTTLVQIGLVQPSTMGKAYEVGARLVHLAKMALVSRDNFREMQRSMNLISDKYDVNLSVFMAFGNSSYISTRVSEGSAPIRIRLSPGQEFPVFRGSPGKFFAAYRVFDAESYRDALAQIGIDNPKKIKRFEAEVREDKKRGWSADTGSTQRGVATLAVPILTTNEKFLGAIELVMFRSQFDQAPIPAIVQDATALAHLLAEHLQNR